MHLTEVAPVTQIRPLRPVVAAVQTWSAVKTAELQIQFVSGCGATWRDGQPGLGAVQPCWRLITAGDSRVTLSKATESGRS